MVDDIQLVVEGLVDFASAELAVLDADPDEAHGLGDDPEEKRYPRSPGL